MAARSSRRGDVIAGLALAALGTSVAVQSLTWQVLGPAGPGPGFFPLIYGGLMVALSLVLVVKAATRRPVHAAAAAALPGEPPRGLPDGIAPAPLNGVAPVPLDGIALVPLDEPAREPAADTDPKAAILIWLLFVAAIAAIKYVGFLVAFGLLLLVTSRLVFSRPLWQGAVAAIIGPALFYLVFVLGLQVRLPLGSVTGF